MIKRDDVPGKKYKIYQEDSNFKYTTDSLILSSFAKVKGLCVDLGCGTGILSLRLVDKVKKFINIDINEEVIKLLNMSVALNELEDKIDNYNIDLKEISKILTRQSVDTVITNPPYYNNGHRVKNNMIDKARYSDFIEDFIHAANYILKNGGKFYCIVPATRMLDISIILINSHIEPKKFQFIKKDISSQAKLVLVEGVKGAKKGYTILPDFILYKNGQISEELNKIYKEV